MQHVDTCRSIIKQHDFIKNNIIIPTAVTFHLAISHDHLTELSSTAHPNQKIKKNPTECLDFSSESTSYCVFAIEITHLQVSISYYISTDNIHC